MLEGGEGALMFASGMAAITAAILAFARPGDTILHSQPLYGGTETLLVGTLAPFGLKAQGFMDGLHEAAVMDAVTRSEGTKVPIIYVESPANPTCGIVDFELMTKAADAIEKLNKNVKIYVGLVGDLREVLDELLPEVTENDHRDWLAQHDPLTGLSNRVSYTERVQAAIATATERRHGIGHAGTDGAGIAHIGTQHHCAPARRLDVRHHLRGRRLRLVVVHDHLHALGGIGPRHGGTDAGAGAGHQRHFALKIVHVHFLLLCCGFTCS